MVKVQDGNTRLFYRRHCVVRNMASYSSLTALFPVQSQLDYALEDATTEEEQESLVYQYLKKLDDKEDFKIPDFEQGKCCQLSLNSLHFLHCGKYWLHFELSYIVQYIFGDTKNPPSYLCTIFPYFI